MLCIESASGLADFTTLMKRHMSEVVYFFLCRSHRFRSAKWNRLPSTGAMLVNKDSLNTDDWIVEHGLSKVHFLLLDFLVMSAPS